MAVEEGALLGNVHVGLARESIHIPLPEIERELDKQEAISGNKKYQMARQERKKRKLSTEESVIFWFMDEE